MIRRVNVLGGPGSGKTVFAAELFANLKVSGFNVEHITEYVKGWTYDGRTPKEWDQVYFLGKQLYNEHRMLSNGVDLIVTDCPLWLVYFYGVHHKCKVSNEILEMCKKFEVDFPSINVTLNRENKVYDELGRFQTYDEACTIDSELDELLNNIWIPKTTMSRGVGVTKISYHQLEMCTPDINVIKERLNADKNSDSK